MRVDFIADITCPWCAIGLASLERAVASLDGEIAVELHLQPFELNPDIGPEGEPIADYAARKYGVGPARLAERQMLIRAQAAAIGLEFRNRTHVYNTLDAHRLLHWSASQGRQLALERALLRAYHERGENPSCPGVLLYAAAEVGLDRIAAGDMLGRGMYASEVRAISRQWQRIGISGVPAVVIDGRQIVQGYQEPEAYANALRDAAGSRRSDLPETVPDRAD